VLVPADISDTEDRYIRDFELAYLLRLLVDKGLAVTVVLDSCHSGSATRAAERRVQPGANEVGVRYLGVVEKVFPPSPVAVASDGELAAMCASLAPGGQRSFGVDGGWLVEPKGYVLLSACRASEYAHEFPFDSQRKQGVLTYWLLDTLKQLDRGMTYEMVYDRVLAKVHSQFADQTPQLQGERYRAVFGNEAAVSRRGAAVFEVTPDGRHVMLNAGQSQAVRKGALFALYGNRSRDIVSEGARIALARVVELGATVSRAEVTKQLAPEPPREGDQAVLIDPGESRLSRGVRVVRAGVPESAAAALGEVERLLTNAHEGLVRLVGEGQAADFVVAIGDGNRLVVCEPSGEEVPNLRPPLDAADPAAPARVLERVLHLARYRNVFGLDNWDTTSPLAHALSVEAAGWQADYTPGDEPLATPFPEGSVPSVREGEWVFLRILNKHTQVLNVTLLNLRPDWGIRQIYPSGAALFEPLDPGRTLRLPMRAGLPNGYSEGRDVLKVFATVGPSNFRPLELPTLDEPLRPAPTRGGAGDQLEDLMSAVMLYGAPLRDMTVAAAASSEWTTAQVEIEVRSS
jgi:hypothetical protein